MPSAALNFSPMLLSAARSSPTARRVRAWWFRQWHRTQVRRRGAGHEIQFGDALLDRCRINVSGRSNRLEFGPGARLWDVSIELHGENLSCHIGAGCRLRGGTLVIEDQGSRVEIGAGSTFFQPVIVASEGCTVRCGEDCLAAYGTDIRNSDGHSLLDSSGQRTNHAADIAIGRHVWLGIQSQVLKGVAIGEGAIVAARAIVNHNVPARALVGGIPARVLREDVTWDHRRL